MRLPITDDDYRDAFAVMHAAVNAVSGDDTLWPLLDGLNEDEQRRLVVVLASMVVELVHDSGQTLEQYSADFAARHLDNGSDT